MPLSLCMMSHGQFTFWYTRNNKRICNTLRKEILAWNENFFSRRLNKNKIKVNGKGKNFLSTETVWITKHFFCCIYFLNEKSFLQSYIFGKHCFIFSKISSPEKIKTLFRIHLFKINLQFFLYLNTYPYFLP